MSRSFTVLDVFTDTAFGGNQLALISDASGLSDAAMQAVAREFNFSESIFLLPPHNNDSDLKARIFTPGMEIPFAGHPNVGLGVWASEAGGAFGKRFGDRILVEEGAGLVSIELTRDEAGASATLTAPAPLSLGVTLPVARIAAAAGLSPNVVRMDVHPPQVASVGMGFVCAELSSVDSLNLARPVAEAFDPLGEGDLHEVLLYVRTGRRVDARMFAPPHGIPEDPATGSAAAALAGLLAHLDPLTDIDLVLDVRQGAQLGRPSRIAASATKRSGTVEEVRVGGRAVVTMTGALRI